MSSTAPRRATALRPRPRGPRGAQAYIGPSGRRTLQWSPKRGAARTPEGSATTGHPAAQPPPVRGFEVVLPLLCPVAEEGRQVRFFKFFLCQNMV